MELFGLGRFEQKQRFKFGLISSFAFKFYRPSLDHRCPVADESSDLIAFATRPGIALIDGAAALVPAQLIARELL